MDRLSRTQVELFCVDQLIMVEIVTEDEFVHFNFAFPTNKVAGEASVSGSDVPSATNVMAHIEGDISREQPNIDARSAMKMVVTPMKASAMPKHLFLLRHGERQDTYVESLGQNWLHSAPRPQE